MPKPRTKLQNKAIHVLLAKNHIDAELKAEMVSRITGGRTTHTSALSFAEANQMIEELRGTPVRASRRTEQYQRQRAGVVQLITPEQHKLLEELAAARWGEGWNLPLTALCERMLRKRAPHTTADANKIIEAIKAMNARDGIRKEAA